MTSPRIVHSDDVICMAAWQNVLINDTAGRLEVEHMKRLERGYRDLLSSYPEGVVCLAFLRPGTPVARAAARNEAARFIKELGDSLKRTAFVIEDRGVLAQVMQTVLRGVNVLIRNPKLVSFSSADDAIESIVPLVAATPGQDVAADLRAAVATVRNGYAPAAATRPKRPARL